jgi:Ca-activated chloride channel family protein
VHTVGIDRAVNAGFLGRLAAVGAGRTELVESEDRLDEAMEHIHHRIGAPLVTDLVLHADGLTLVDGTRAPHRLPGLYPGVPLVISGRYAGAPAGTLTVTGRTRDDEEFRTTVAVRERAEPAITAQWARARLRDLEDRYAAGERTLEKSIVDTSLRFGVLCRFTAYVAVDSRVVNENGETRRVTQPVDLPSGWETPLGDPAPPMAFVAGSAAAAMPLAAPARPGGPRFAPVRARAADAGRPAGAPQPFAAVPGSLRRPRAEVFRPQTPVADLRELARVEAERLTANRGRPRFERRAMLSDLSARLKVLLGDRAEPELAPLRALLEYLAGGDDLETRWAEAHRVLAEFGGGDRPRRDRSAFWKR